MNQVPDRKRLRREYVRKKGSAYVSSAIYGLLLVPTILVGGLFAVAALYGTVLNLVALCTNRPEAHSATVSVTLLSLMVSIVVNSTAYFCWQQIKQAHKEASIFYAPPFTASTLPADEILVRGASEPAAQSEVLLRAATEQETPKEELLRVSGGE